MFYHQGEGTFGANAGLPDVAVGLLKPISEKYVPDTISNADLWALAANVAIKVEKGKIWKNMNGMNAGGGYLTKFNTKEDITKSGGVLFALHVHWSSGNFSEFLIRGCS